jgi:DNA-binding MarR family transcriptional regulator
MHDKPVVAIPEAGEGKRGEQGHLAYLLRQASAAIRQAIDRHLADLGVTQPQFLVMTMIAAYPGCSSADLARLTMLTPPTISLIVANLERSGRLTRAVSAAHGRVQQLALTVDGAALLAVCKQRVGVIEERLDATVPPALAPVLRRWLVDVATTDFG